MASAPPGDPPTYQQAAGTASYGYNQPPPGQPTYAFGTAPQPAYAGTEPPPEEQTFYGTDQQTAFNAASFSDKVIRNRFIRKVYLILMCQLLFTTAMVAIFISVTDVKTWVQRNSWFYYLSYVTFLITYIVLACCPSVRLKYPGNYIALFVFTAMFSYVCATIASFYDAQAVLIAAGITALVTLSISLFAIQTKIDFTMCYSLMFAASMTLFFLGFAFLIVYLVIPPGENGKNLYYLQCVYGGIAALILCLFLVFDTQRIVGGKNRKNPVSPEEHILGAMELYLDVVYLFLIILSFFGGGSRD
ncbi:protein lifeguard 2-like [Watersipora subatra]|uniref:protein lifeguard 2-like n=1 Tax=Watersipora subatra TaxID=2589382 RepID=UPI00355AE4F6